MRILNIRAMEGPNLFHDRPVLAMRLSLGAFTEVESCDLPGFNERLLALLPGLAEHHCSKGRPGGFVERLATGTYFGHIVEHVALELAGLLGSPVTYGKTRYAGERGVYQVIVRYRSEAGMRWLLRSAVALVECVAADEPFDVPAHLEAAKRAAADAELGPSTRGIVAAAERRGIPWRRLNDANLVQLGHGSQRRLVQAAVTDATSQVAADIASDKALTKRLLRDAGVPVPRGGADGGAVTTLEEALAAFSELGGEVVVKPLDGNQGRGVTVGVRDEEQLAAAYQLARAVSPEVIVEERFPGSDFRVLVVGGRFVAAARREPCCVIGDGSATVSELIEQTNRDPLRGEGHARPLTKIQVDDEVRSLLASAGLGLDSVVPEGELVPLRGRANLSQGATASDVTDAVSQRVKALCERAAKVVGLDICGVDLVARDLGDAFDGGVIEVNAGPGLRMHLHPSAGRSRDVGERIVAMLFPEGATGRVPICSVTGTNGKTTVTRLLAHMLATGGLVTGVASTGGIYVGGERLREGDLTGAESARTVLSNPAVEAAVLETARGGILNRGLGYDLADVAVITNVSADHLGQDGIEDLSDLVWIKSLVAEKVAPNGRLVLNAEDPMSARIAASERVAAAGAELTYFARSAGNATLAAHRAAGGLAYFVRRGWLVEARGDSLQPLADLARVPLTVGGSVGFQVLNCLAAAAAARGLGCAVTHVAEALASFRSTLHNPGRVNAYRVGAGGVILDYGHNPAAFRATGELARAWQGPVAGVVGVPGDRSDELIEEAARAAAESFDHLLLREDVDLRGREPGEVPALMLSTIRAVAPGKRCRLVPGEADALRELLEEARYGTLAVIYSEDVEKLQRVIEQAGAEPVELSELLLQRPDAPQGRRPDTAAAQLRASPA